MRPTFISLAALALLAACATSPTNTGPRIGPDGQPLPTVYRISGSDEDRIKIRMQDSVNALRRSSGLPELSLDSKLIAAAATHSRDMSVQNRPWNFGSDGSSPLDRIARVGYAGGLVGENIRETYETELETLSAWMEEPGPRAVILDPRARNMGFDWFQEPNGKIWWTLVLGS
jgi:uncharacterized protein YkwD